MDEERQDQPQSLAGTVKAVIFQNEENGYTVLRLDTGAEEPVTVVGCLPFAAPGEGLEVEGTWERHPSHGEQFKAVSVRRSLPVGESHIFEYLASGAVKGIGPATAAMLVSKFGPRTLEVLQDDPEKLALIRGISARKAREISETFRRQSGMRLLMEFMAANGLKPEYAMRLYKLYGDSAMAMLKDNPYLIASDRVGGHFAEADALALSLGFEPDSPQRISAALVYEMVYNLNNGHSFLPREKLCAAAAQLIGVEEEAAEECLDVLADSGDVVVEPVANVTAVYLRRLYEAENYTAEALSSMARQTVPFSGDLDAAIDDIESRSGIRFAAMQRRAIGLAATRRLLAITGGPGTGKTTIIRGILDLLDRQGVECLLAAPTGRAAKRMSELTGREAATVHRLLGAAWEAQGDELSFRKNEDDPLRCGAVILDECSMVDITLIQALLKALPKDCRLVLVGDEDQLPSVGPGNFFLDVLRSGAVAGVRLTEVFRQSGESHIIRNAHAINRGEMPDLRENKKDFFFLQRPTGERMVSTITELCRDRLPKNMGIPSSEIQVLTPTRMGDTGTGALNRRLQEALNPPAPGKKEKIFGQTVFREGDRVMQIRNNYDIVWCRGGDREAIMDGKAAPGSAPEVGSGIFNGDLGIIARIDSDNELLWIDFDDRLAWYGFEQLNELDHAFAVTVHKSQGSEYRAVILSAGRAPARLLSRDLLYTAVTRARELLLVVGETAVFQAMVDNGRKTRRYSGLRWRLAEKQSV
ncbi:MAG: AAA family ATPase [Oscillospiraceae bacterium]|nr:AAA family ATPase [Oscillospiraceae bacterium]